MALTKDILKARLAPYALTLKIGAVVLTLALAAGAGAYVRGAFAEAEEHRLKTEHALALAATVKKKNEELQLVQKRSRELEDLLKGVTDARSTRESEHRHEVAIAVDELDKLRRLIAARAGQQRPCTAATAGGTAATARQPEAPAAPGVVQGTGDSTDQLYGEAVAAVAELAPALQRSHETHAELAAFYERARAQLRRWGQAGRDVAK